VSKKPFLAKGGQRRQGRQKEEEEEEEEKKKKKRETNGEGRGKNEKFKRTTPGRTWSNIGRNISANSKFANTTLDAEAMLLEGVPRYPAASCIERKKRRCLCMAASRASASVETRRKFLPVRDRSFMSRTVPMLRTKAEDAREGTDPDETGSRVAALVRQSRGGSAAGIMIRYSLTETGEERNFPLLAAVVPTIVSRM
jgi:hypothetical protein